MAQQPLSAALGRIARRSARTGTSFAKRAKQICLEAVDSSLRRFPATILLRGQPPRDPNSQTARLAERFIELNRSLFNHLEVEAESHFDGSSVEIALKTATQVGAIPLISPTSQRLDYGLIVRPRFDWPGIGPILANTGWKIVPNLLRLPPLEQSEPRIPLWVLSTVILFRIKALLQNLERGFEIVKEERSAPRGTVDWAHYACRNLGRARFTDVPCSFPQLRANPELRKAIRYTIERHQRSLEGQRAAGVFVVELIQLCRLLLERLSDVTAREPGALEITGWQRARLIPEGFREGIQAIEWTVENRGLAGKGDLQGLSWSMSMEQLFEAWAETVVSATARRVGGVLRTGRRRQTLAPINWDPPYLGSQKYLLPDLVLERGDTTIIVDAKYKEHWEEMQRSRWSELEQEVKERHREDLLQVLAYSNLPATPRVMVCLAYPCNDATWNSLRARHRLFHRASLGGARRVDLLLTAFPMSTRNLSEVVATFAEEIAAA